MKTSEQSILRLFVILLFSFVAAANTASAFIPISNSNKTSRFGNIIKMSNNNNEDTPAPPSCGGEPHPFSMLPGDPSLVLVTNVDLGDKKLDIMKGK